METKDLCMALDDWDSIQGKGPPKGDTRGRAAWTLKFVVSDPHFCARTSNPKIKSANT